MVQKQSGSEPVACASVLTYVPESSIPPDASQVPSWTGAKTVGRSRIWTATGDAAPASGGAKPAIAAVTAIATAAKAVLMIFLPG
jgi:hypothetical protein